MFFLLISKCEFGLKMYCAVQLAESPKLRVVLVVLIQGSVIDRQPSSYGLLEFVHEYWGLRIRRALTLCLRDL